ncbi:signal peptide protein [Kitasatospora brasiliensis]|uniref:signal peptide protein n=1 Tax=Kitasatospora brasiliensis TaxID=3058040 RepID=UPI002930B860|nr:signal peptide protein [Kitasatospora sp. K002]
MRTRKIPRRSLALAAALAALPTVAVASPAVATTPGAPPVRFVELPSSPLPSDHGQRTINVTYRNDSSTDRTVAPQVLVESPANGPFLSPSSIRLEVLAPDGHWRTLPLGNQTGTLYTRLVPAKLVLHGHHTLNEQYRLTVIGRAPAQGTIEPRVALYA